MVSLSNHAAPFDRLRVSGGFQQPVRALGARRAWALVTAVLALVLDLHVTFAHAELARSDPPADAIIAAAPNRVTLWFTEEPEVRFSEIQILDRGGRRVDAGGLRSDPTDRLAVSTGLQATEPGTYTVLWKTLSAVDGHVTRGAFGFTVGLDQIPAALLVGVESSPPVTADRVIVRVLSYIGLAGLLGAFPFVRWVLLPACAAGGGVPATRARVLRSGWTLALIATGCGLLATLGALVSQAAAAFDVALVDALGPAASLAVSTRFGLLWWARAGLLLALGGLVLAALRIGPAPSITAGGCVLGASVLLVQALGSHAAASQGATGTAVALDWIHLIAAVVWTGGLTHLLLTLATLRGSQHAGEAPRVAARLVPRFSVVGVLGVSALLLTGVYQSWLLVGSLPALVGTPYGQALLLKLGLVVPLAALGAVNLLVLRPRLLRWASVGNQGAGPRARDAPRLHPLYATVAGETAFAVAVIAGVGVLTNLQPGREAQQAQGIVASAAAEDVRATLRVQPGTAGLNRFEVALRDRVGRPMVDAEKVALRFTMLAMDMGESEIVAYHRRDGHYVAQGGPLVMGGPWRIELVVRRPGQDDARPEAEIVVADQPLSGPGLATAPAAEGRLLLGIEFLLLAALAFAYAFWLAPGQAQALRLILPAAAAVLAGSLMAGSGAAALRGASVARNPIAPTPASVARGGVIYAERCAVCHGESGRGDGPPRSALHCARLTSASTWRLAIPKRSYSTG